MRTPSLYLACELHADCLRTPVGLPSTRTCTWAELKTPSRLDKAADLPTADSSASQCLYSSEPLWQSRQHRRPLCLCTCPLSALQIKQNWEHTHPGLVSAEQSKLCSTTLKRLQSKCLIDLLAAARTAVCRSNFGVCAKVASRRIEGQSRDIALELCISQ